MRDFDSKVDAELERRKAMRADERVRAAADVIEECERQKAKVQSLRDLPLWAKAIVKINDVLVFFHDSPHKK
ncbi:hypothetical protein [Rugamonas apoptosis]|uniref:Uncharacterized protein n=1 Tax=Rugamonas apoptosis TaxID=2758570 RepID=A0A7W2FCL7_9BURK|nr:hypothetical protein [Rugamonas apoptosis]MBA5689144.1 hypothetical protein [Rugamonas apoptosis]